MKRLSGAIVSAGLCLSLAACSAGAGAGSLVAGASVDTITVMTFNIFHDRADPDRAIPGWPERKHLVVATIRSAMPDVVGLQEALPWQVRFLVQQLPKYDFVGRGRDPDGGGETVAILFRNDLFDPVDQGHFWFSDTPETPGSKGDESWGDMTLPRMTTWVRLRRTDSGTAFYVYNTHLASDGTAADAALSRARSVRLLARRIAGRKHSSEYFVVTGDFNATENQEPVELLQQETGTVDAWRSKNRGEGGGGTRCRNNGSERGERIDYIFVRDPVPGDDEAPDVIEAETVGWKPSCASDHRAVLAALELPAAP